jgi:CYTH domain-containing protein
MGIEIERKFLIENDDWKKSIKKEFVIRQAYLASDPERTVRVRIKEDKGTITIKGITTNATRAEYEYEIPLQDAKEMIELGEKPIIEKRRYIVNEHQKTWEIDVFERENQGLVLAEIELGSEDEAIELPAWIGKEVTQEEKYYNANLMRYPFSKW